MRKAWWGLTIVAAILSEASFAEAIWDIGVGSRACAAHLLADQLRSRLSQHEFTRLLPSRSQSPEIVLATAGWLRFQGFSFAQIDELLRSRELRLAAGDVPAAGSDSAALVEAYREAMLVRAVQLDPRHADTARKISRSLLHANVDLETIAALLTQRRVPYADPEVLIDGGRVQWVANYTWTKNDVERLLASPLRPGVIYHRLFENPQAMEGVVDRAVEIRRAAFEQLASKLRSSPSADWFYAMAPRSDDEQKTLFLAMNYALHRAALAQDVFGPLPPVESPAKSQVDRYRALAEDFREVIHRSNTRLVRLAAKTFQPRFELDELVGEGQLALYRAIETFDVRQGFTFATWGSRVVRNRFIAMGKHAKRDKRSIALESTSLEAWGEDGEALDAEDVDVVPPDFALIQQEDTERLRALLETLDERERSVLERRFGLADGDVQTLQEVGDALGVTKEAVRKIEQRAVTKLNRGLGAEY